MSATAGVASGFYKLTWPERLQALAHGAHLADDDLQRLLRGQALLSADGADRMVENVIGVLGLPLAVATGMVVDGTACLTPMVVEEPSIVAALSSAAKVIGRSGGFTTHMDGSLLAGQIQLVGVADTAAAGVRLLAHKEALLQEARACQPGMVARGGGPVDLTVTRPGTAADQMLIVQLWVDTCDAMGANAVNTLCEAMAHSVARAAGDGTVGLRILSNLCSRSLVTAHCRVPAEDLAHKQHTGAFVRDRIVAASRMAELDVDRATTHNKGVMNGVDGVALATGNDWRAIEAAAHAWAGRGTGYRPLTQWLVGQDGALEGTLCMPLKVGTVGGNFLANPTVALALRLVRAPSAQRLARLMAAVGLAQNFAALKALGTVGIQSGHMALHARSVVASAGARPEHFDAAVARLLAGQDIKLSHAQRIVAELEGAPAMVQVQGQLQGPRYAGADLASASRPKVWAEGFGKLIVLGEHAVVYRSHALAVPLMLATRVGICRLQQDRPMIWLRIPEWGIDEALPQPPQSGSKHQRLFDSIRLIVSELNLMGQAFEMTVQPHVPRAMGLGSSAALAVATVRALSCAYSLGLGEQAVIDLAFQAEKLAHGTPSGVDNALATLGAPLLFQRGDPGPKLAAQAVGAPLHWVVGLSHEESLTATTVTAVREAHGACPALYDALFAQIDALTLEAAAAMREGNTVHLGRLMNINHGLLNALGVSTPQIEQLVFLARAKGALGAKVTGGGGGGSMLTLCANSAKQQEVATAFERAGFRALVATTEESQ